jgi:NAD(P)H-hydrate epimerase
MNSRPALQVPATLGMTRSEDILDGIVLGLLSQDMNPFLAPAAVVWLHSPAETAFGSGWIAEAPSDLLPGASRTLLASASPACLRRLQ